MLTHCPECNGELSTAAAACPHCGAPVAQGKIAQPEPIVVQKKSHFLRNCLICGCFLALLGGAALVALPVYMVNQLKAAVVTAADTPVLAAEIAPGTAPPQGYEWKGGVNFSMFGFKAKGVCVAPKGALGGGQSFIVSGGFSQKRTSKEEIHDAVTKFLQAMETGPKTGHSGSTTIISHVEEELPIGAGTETVKAQHMVSEDDETKKRATEYVVILDKFPNEFGHLVIVGIGPETGFDLDGFKAFLKTVKTN
jgi:hypothetical protein